MPKWKVCWNMKPDDHTYWAFVNYDAGFRPISLSMYGKSSEPVGSRLYSSIWVQRPYGTFKLAFVPLVDEDGIWGKLAEMKAKGFYPLLIAGYGGGTGAYHYSLFFREGGPETYVAIDAIPKATSAGLSGLNWVMDARRVQMKFPRSAVVVGVNDSLAKLHFAFIWEPQPTNKKYYWNGILTEEPSVNHVDGAMVQGFARAELGGISEASEAHPSAHFVIYRDDRIPGHVYYSSVSATLLDDLIEKRPPGTWPLRIHGCGAMGPTQKFDLIMAQYPHETEPARTLHVKRPAYPYMLEKVGTHPWDVFKELDDYVVGVMKKNSVRAAQVAVTYQGRLVHDAAFTWGQPGYPINLPTTRMGIGSMSKPITVLASCQLWDEGKFSAASVLDNIDSLMSQNFADPGFAQRTVEQLHYHLSYLDEAGIGAAAYPQAVAAFNNVPYPVSATHIVNFIAANVDPAFTGPAPSPKFDQPTNPTPKPTASYSGTGIMILGELVRQQAFYPTLQDVLIEKLFAPLGVTRARVAMQLTANALPAAIAGDEVLYHMRKPEVSGSQVKQDQLGTANYEASNKAATVSNGNVVLALADYARVFAAFDGEFTGTPNPLFSSAMQDKVLTEGAKGWYRGFVKGAVSLTALPSSGGGISGTTLQHGGPASASSTSLTMGHNGSGSGACALGFRRLKDGVSIIVAFNCNMYGGLGEDGTNYGFPFIDSLELNKRLNVVSAWPTWDLFEALGIQ